MNGRSRWLVVAVAVLLTAHLAPAADQVVSDLGDSGGANQLRAKITACLNSGGGSITFASGLSGTITLGSALPQITPVGPGSVTVMIDGGNAITISGADKYRIFSVASSGTLVVNNVTLSHASATGDGGAISSLGAVSATNAKFLNNATSADASGSAILCWKALTLTGCEFGFNTGGGGAVKPRSSTATTTITNCNFHDNQSTSSGGGGYGGAMQLHDAPFVTVNGSTFSTNKAGATGGAIVVDGGSSLTITNCQILTNTAQTGGAGIYAYGTLNVISSTISENVSSNLGGGVAVEKNATISGTHIYKNTANVAGGGIAVLATGSLTISANSRVEQNSVYGDGGGIHSRGALVINASNIQYNTTDGGFDTYGGGIYQEGGSLNMVQSYALNNNAKYGGGLNLVNTTTTLQESGASFNKATVGDGGGIRSMNSTVTLTYGAANFNQTATVGGGISNAGTLTISDRAQVYYNLASHNGGGIYQSSGNTTIISSTLGNNQACCGLNGGAWGMGGGIYNADGTVTLRNALVDSNVANTRGGGILNFATLSVESSTISRNVSYGGDQVTQTYGGGGIYNFATATILTSTIRGNSTTTLDGGGFYNGWYGNAMLDSVTLSDNSADQDGGGFKNNKGVATLTNVTFSGNKAKADGGGVFNDDAQTNLRHVTFSDNSAYNGGAIYNLATDSTRTVSLQNTIIANSSSGYNCVSDFPGSLNVVSQGYNLSDDGSFTSAGHCPAFGGADQNNTNPRLSALGNYGGATTGVASEPLQTYLLLPGSPAIDAILGGVSGCGSTFQKDERGVARPQDGDANGGFTCDIGAVEVKPNETPPSPTPTPTPTATSTPTATATPTPAPGGLANISTRLRVETGDNVLIGGFIVSGTQPKKVIIRAIGTSLPLADRLENPTLELHGPNGLIESNDNWVDSPNKQAIIDSTIPPTSDQEAAIVQTLPANNTGYTAIVRGAGGTTGIGVVEAYDLDSTANSTLANISTRGLVQTGDNVLFAGMIVVGSPAAAQKVIIRGIGPSLPIPGVLADPTLALYDANGALLEENDNWVDSPNKQAIIDSTVPPSNDSESAIVRTLTPANYTAIVRGVNNTTGIAVVEVYALQ